MPQPLYRITFDCATLLREHPPQFGHPHKRALFEIAYPPGTTPAGEIEVTRWLGHVEEPIALPREQPAEVVPNFYDYRPVANRPADVVEWHVNFADPRLFFAYGSGLFAQDEMQVAEHPLLACVREALVAGKTSAMTIDAKGATPILVTGVERRIDVATKPDLLAGRPDELYGNRFAAAPIEVVRKATRRIDPPTITNLIAMAAPAGGCGEYTEDEIAYVFTTAVTAFTAARFESHRLAGPAASAIVHTGFWGCGAFGGNRRLMIALQSLAARAAGIDRLILHTGDTAGASEAQAGLDVADTLADRCGESCTLDTLVGRCALMGYRWGVSDGN
jgi:hypothetical protein